MPEIKANGGIAAMSFEEALKELEAIVKRLETGSATLEQSIEDYERGSALKAHCEKRLDAARLKVEKLVGQEEHMTTEPFDA